MTTNTELIARLRETYPATYCFTNKPHIAIEAADAIEALEAEVVRLKEQKEVMRLEYKELELQLTEDENIERDRDNALAERDALRAQLAAARETETKYDEALCTVAAQRDAYKDQLAAAQGQQK